MYKFLNKFVRYWYVNGLEECSFGWLISYDHNGVLIGAAERECGDIEGAEYIPYHQIKAVSYFKSDEEE